MLFVAEIMISKSFEEKRIFVTQTYDKKLLYHNFFNFLCNNL